MAYQDEDCDYSEVIETIASMFGDVVNKDVILAVVESYKGDLNLSVEAIMDLTQDSSYEKHKQEGYEKSSSPNIAAGSSYASMALKPKITSESININQEIKSMSSNINKNKKYFWTDEVCEILSLINNGTRIMIIMRGAPGSGKSSLARDIVEETFGSSEVHQKKHIFSTDKYFMRTGQYVFDKFDLGNAHSYNQKQVSLAIAKGLSPIIVDNTHIGIWEMEPYARCGVNGGYIIKILEPSTPWFRDPLKLFKKNIHNVPIETISKMLQNYCQNITGEILLNTYNLKYPDDKTPPVLRKLPNFAPKISSTSSEAIIPQIELESVQDKISVNENIEEVVTDIIESTEILIESECSHKQEMNKEESGKEITTVYKTDSTKKNNLLDYKQSEFSDQSVLEDTLFVEAQNRLEELQQKELEKEWELNESWSLSSNNDKNTAVQENATASAIKPKRARRRIENESVLTDQLKDSVNKCDDWSSFSMFMVPWNDQKQEESTNHIEIDLSLQKMSSGTCFERGDMDPYNSKNYKVLSAIPRDINELYIPFNNEKIPDKRMLDKSSMTNEDVFKQSSNCKCHFTFYRKLFPKIAKDELRNILDDCSGDMNWAVNIVFNSGNLLQQKGDEDFSDIEDDNSDDCQCLFTYQIMPDIQVIKPLESDININLNNPGCSTDIAPRQKRKIKKVNMSDSCMQLKSQIEKNVFISDNHYSDHCLQIRKIRRGECIPVKNIIENSLDSDKPENVETDLLTSSKIEQSDAMNSDNASNDVGKDLPANSNIEQSGDELELGLDGVEKCVPINMGMDFVRVLDRIYGRQDFSYPDNIEAKFSIRVSVLNELNALWIESLTHQFENQAINTTNNDEEFARELVMKEAEFVTGKEPQAIDLKEIMDMELALNLYQKDVDEWKNNQPNDLAAKLSREKLCNLFPDVSPDTLMELLMAHDNNFHNTVEVLLNSMGKSDIANTTGGVNKFIMEKELQRQAQVLEQERQALSEVEWPLLTKGENVDMSTVENYRMDGEKHLQRVNTFRQKASDSIRRGMSEVATFYTQIAGYHRKKFEQANSLAAISLVQLNSIKNPDAATIDLHFLRVSEAIESLDIFIDSHIQRLRESQSKGPPKINTLYLITGRGLHSRRGPRIKPAVKERLLKRRILPTEKNPGLLTIKVASDDILTYELNI